jgi:hypothetical protein
MNIVHIGNVNLAGLVVRAIGIRTNGALETRVAKSLFMLGDL